MFCGDFTVDKRVERDMGGNGHFICNFSAITFVMLHQIMLFPKLPGVIDVGQESLVSIGFNFPSI